MNYTGASTGWRLIPAQSWSATTALTWTLLDNSTDALVISTGGFGALLTFKTTNGAEAVTFGPKALADIATGLAGVSDGQLGARLVVRLQHPGGNVTQSVTLPTRVGGWTIQDAYIRSKGATAGSLQAKGPAAVDLTNAMVPGNADEITRASSILAANEVVATGAQIDWVGVGGPPPATCYLLLVGN
jgi:hypothetical protein